MAAPNQRLQRERKLRGWSQAYIAKQIDAPDYYLSRWERGDVLPSPFYQQKLCELFGKTAEELGFLQPAYDSQIKQMLQEIQESQSINNFALEDVFDSIDAKGLFIALLLDEFEHVTENLNFNAAFFYGLRSLAIHHHLALVTSSRRELIELCHSQAIRSSPFFNIFANINMELFTKNEALDFISSSLNGTKISFTDAEIETIFRIAGNHPYFLQVACSFLFDAYSQNANSQERVISLRKAFRMEADPHLAFYWRSSDDQEKIVLIALTLLGGRRGSNDPNPNMRRLQDLYAHFSPPLARLEKRELVVSIGDTFSLFNETFGEWIWNEITDTKHNQQSYEEWLTSRKGMVEQLKGFPETARKELGDILSRINEEHRELLFYWLIEPKILNLVGRSIKGFLELGWGVSA